MVVVVVMVIRVGVGPSELVCQSHECHEQLHLNRIPYIPSITNDQRWWEDDWFLQYFSVEIGGNRWKWVEDEMATLLDNNTTKRDARERKEEGGEVWDRPFFYISTLMMWIMLNQHSISHSTLTAPLPLTSSPHHVLRCKAHPSNSRTYQTETSLSMRFEIRPSSAQLSAVSPSSTL